MLAAIAVSLHRYCVVFCSIFILCISLILSFQTEKGQVWLGLENPKLLQVRSIRDSRPAGQGSLHFFELLHVGDHRGNWADAHGEFIGWSRDRLDIPWGTELRVRSTDFLDVKSFESLVVVEAADSDIRISEAFRLRRSGRDSLLLRLAILPPPASVLLEALLFGSKQRLLSPLEEGFRQIGCSHLLALSGMHLAVIMTVGAGILGSILRKRTARFAVMLVLPWYLFLVGPSPALLRAGIMFSCSALVSRSTRRIETRDLLLQSFILLLIIKPDFLFDRGFQFSFAALAGMIALTPVFMKFLLRLLPYSFAAGLSSGISAYLGSLPVSLLAYGSTNPVGIAATLVLSPLIWLYLSGGILFLLLPGLPFISGAARIFFWLLHSAIQRLVELFSCVSSCTLPPVMAMLCAAGVGGIIAVRLIYSSLRFTMAEPAHPEVCSE